MWGSKTCASCKLKLVWKFWGKGSPWFDHHHIQIQFVWGRINTHPHQVQQNMSLGPLKWPKEFYIYTLTATSMILFGHYVWFSKNKSSLFTHHDIKTIIWWITTTLIVYVISNIILATGAGLCPSTAIMSKSCKDDTGASPTGHQTCFGVAARLPLDDGFAKVRQARAKLRWWSVALEWSALPYIKDDKRIAKWLGTAIEDFRSVMHGHYNPTRMTRLNKKIQAIFNQTRNSWRF